MSGHLVAAEKWLNIPIPMFSRTVKNKRHVLNPGSLAYPFGMQSAPPTVAFKEGPDFAAEMDARDPLRDFREEFHIPIRQDGTAEIYLVGNSLGLQPRKTLTYVAQELYKWHDLGVRAHFESDLPWMPYHEFLTEPMAGLVGAKPLEVVMMNSLTTNLHLMMVSFYRPTSERNKILIEERAFPSDRYAVESQIRFHGYDPGSSLMVVAPPEGDDVIPTDHILDTIRKEGHSIALVLLPGVQYYTGQLFDIAAITRVAHEHGCLVGFDLAHAAGNVPLQLHDWDVDFACWCTYKYLNSGPGSVAGCFVHERFSTSSDLPRFTGWWGHDKATRFLMGPEFRPLPGAEGWQLSNPPILSLAAIRASLEVFTEAGGMQTLREKSELLTGYLEWLLQESLEQEVRILTPCDPSERGSQLSLQIRSAAVSGKSVFDSLEARGVRCDWREPDVIRLAPVPLYNSYGDVFEFVSTLRKLLQ